MASSCGWGTIGVALRVKTQAKLRLRGDWGLPCTGVALQLHFALELRLK